MEKGASSPEGSLCENLNIQATDFLQIWPQLSFYSLIENAIGVKLNKTVKNFIRNIFQRISVQFRNWRQSIFQLFCGVNLVAVINAYGHTFQSLPLT